VTARLNVARRLSAVHRNDHRVVREIDFIGVLRRDQHARVIVRALGQDVLIVDDLPLLAAIVRAPERAFAVPTCLDQRINALRIARRNGDSDLAERGFGQALRGHEPLPRRATIGRFEHAAPLSAAVLAPGVDHKLPCPGEQYIRIGWIHRQLRHASVLVDKERLLPGLAAVLSAIDAALLLRPVAVPDRADVYDVRVGGMNDDARDAPRELQTHARPGFARIGRFVDAVADGYSAANPALTRPGPHDVVIRRADCQRADGLRFLFVENWLPHHTAVGGLPHSARSRACVIDVLVARRADHRSHAIARRTDVAELQAAQVTAVNDSRAIGHLGLYLWLLWRAPATLRLKLHYDGARHKQRAENEAKGSVHVCPPQLDNPHIFFIAESSARMARRRCLASSRTPSKRKNRRPSLILTRPSRN